MTEYEPLKDQLMMRGKNTDLKRESRKQRIMARRAKLSAWWQRVCNSRSLLRDIDNRILCHRLSIKCAEARKYSVESLSKIYVFKAGRDFAVYRKKDIQNRNRHSRNSYSMEWVRDNCIAEYWNGKCVEHANFKFNKWIKF